MKSKSNANCWSAVRVLLAGKVCAGLKRFMVSEEDELLSSEMILKVAGSPVHGPHFQ